MVAEASDGKPTQGSSAAPLSRLVAWRNVIGITALAWLVLALPNFGLLTDYLSRTMQGDLVRAALLLDLGFGASAVVIIALMVRWQHARGETLRDLGWRKPTTTGALIGGVLYGGLWVSLTYAAAAARPHDSFLTLRWERFVMMPIGVLISFCEELMFRGFLMNQLRRAGVGTGIQVLASAVCIASYHGLVGRHYSLFYAVFSIPLFAALAGIHVWGKRSLTPNTIAHSMTHVLADPFLMMGILYGAIHFGEGF